MKAIGFRVEPGRVHWAVVEGPDEPLKLVDHGDLSAPDTYSEPASLAWYRTETKNLIARFSPNCAGVRFPEPSARQGAVTSTHRRLRIEGVLLETCQGRIETIATGALKSIAGRLGTASPKDYLVSDSLRGLDWSRIKAPYRREAIMVAASVLG